MPRTAIFNYPFTALCLVAPFGFGNIAVFYGWYPCLMTGFRFPGWIRVSMAREEVVEFCRALTKVLRPGRA